MWSLCVNLLLLWCCGSALSQTSSGKIKSTLQVVVSNEQDIITMAPVVKLLQEYYFQHIATEIIHVHMEGRALEATMSLLKLAADRRFDFTDQDLSSTASIVSRSIDTFSALFSHRDEDMGRVVVVVQGASGVAAGAAMAAHYQRIPVIHVNAGSASGDMMHPHPGEFHRITVNTIASLCLVSTSSDRDGLVRHGVNMDKIAVTGSSIGNVIQELSIAALSSEDEEINQMINDKIVSHWKRSDNKQQVVVIPSGDQEEVVVMIEALGALASQYPQYLYFFLLPSELASSTEFSVSLLRPLENVEVMRSPSSVMIMRLLRDATVVMSGTNNWVEEAIFLNTHCVLVSNISTWIDAETAGVLQRVSPLTDDIIRITGSRLASLADIGKNTQILKLYGDEYSRVRSACRIASLALDVGMNVLSNFQCGHDSAGGKEFFSSVDSPAPLPRRVDPDDVQKTEQATEALTVNFPLTSHPSSLFRPNYEAGRVTVVLTQYKRNTTELQLRAIFAQTCFSRVDRIVIFQNEEFVDLSFLKDIDFSSEILEPSTPQNHRNLQWNRKKQPNKMHDIIQIVHSPHYNYKFYGRFALALTFDTEFTSIFDDDTIPQPCWLEYATKTSDEMRAIVGPVGVLISKNKQRYLNAPLDFGLEVDYTGHSWVFKTEWLKYLWREYVPSWDAGEDIAFSALAWMHGRVRTVMPKMSTDEYELWGDSIKIFHKDGNESSSYSVPTAIRWPLTRYWLSQGFVPCMLRGIDNRADSICVGNDACKAIYYSMMSEDEVSTEAVTDRMYPNTNRQKMLSEHITEQIVLKVKWMEDLGRPVTHAEIDALKRKSRFEPYHTRSPSTVLYSDYQEEDDENDDNFEEGPTNRRRRRRESKKQNKPRGKGSRKRRRVHNGEF